MQPPPLVSIIIVNCNGRGFLQGCLESIFNQSCSDFEIIFIDNGSTDDSVQYVKEKFPDVIIIENRENLGFARANNQGIAIAKGKYIALLNNDTVVDREWIKSLLAKAESSSEKVGMWAGKILSMQEPGKIDSVGGLMISPDGIAKGRGRLEEDVGQYDNDDEVFIPSACAALFKKEMLDEIGLFDEDFFAYCEDTDIGLRARLAGWRTVSVPKAVVYHYYSGTTGKYTSMKAYLVERNHVWLAVKNFPLSRLLFFPFYTIWRDMFQVYGILLKRGAGGRFVEDFSGARLFIILVKTFWSALGGIPMMARKRHSVQAKRAVSKKEISDWFKRYGLSMKELVLKD
jgi:GT2 family glycosyltransferase